jgi:hypothetical protein
MQNFPAGEFLLEIMGDVECRDDMNTNTAFDEPGTYSFKFKGNTYL